MTDERASAQFIFNTYTGTMKMIRMMYLWNMGSV